MNFGSPQYIEWLKNLKIGDMVKYEKRYGVSKINTVMTKAKVTKITATGRIRLDDGTTWYHTGKGQAIQSRKHILPFTAQDELAIQTQTARRTITNFVNRPSFKEVSAEDILKMLSIVAKYTVKEME